MTSDPVFESKLNTLVQKLHEYLAHSSEESEDTTSPTRQSVAKSAAKPKSAHRLHAMETNTEEGATSDPVLSPGTPRSKRKPSIVTKYVESDEEPKEEVIADSDPEVDMESLPLGTVVVQPEPVLNEDKDDFKGPEFRSRNKVKADLSLSKKRPEDGLHGIVSCTACGQQVNHFHKDSIHRHPALQVLICKSCFKYYMSDDINRDADGMDEQCRWCAEGGNLICCDFCHNAFCKTCILRNLGRRELSTIMDEESKWQCYMCQPEPLLDLVAACNSVFDNLEQLLQQNKKKIKVENDKGKICDQNQKTSSCNGQEKLDRFYSGAITYSFKALMVPKEMVKKTKRIVETTTNLNKSFIKFLKHESENAVVNSATNFRQLKAFKSVLGDLKKAHEALEESLALELASVRRKTSSKKSKEVTGEPKASKEKRTNEEDQGTANVCDGEKVSNCDSENHQASEESPENDHHGKPGEMPDVEDLPDDEEKDPEVSSTKGSLDDDDEDDDAAANDDDDAAAMEVEEDADVQLAEDDLVTVENKSPSDEDKKEKEEVQEDRNAESSSDEKSHKSPQNRKKKVTEKSKRTSGESKRRSTRKEPASGAESEDEGSVASPKETKSSASPKAKSDRSFEPNAGEALDMDIVSVPSAVPEDIFDSLDSTLEAHNALNESALKTSKKDDPQAKTPVKKELILKLTPLSFSKSPEKTPKKKAKGSGSDNEARSSSNEPSSDNEDPKQRKSPRVKTTPKRRQNDSATSLPNAEEESHVKEKKKPKSEPSKKEKKEKRSSSSSAATSKSRKSKKSDEKTLKSGSDSEEMPEVLKKAALMSNSSSEPDSGTEAKQAVEKDNLKGGEKRKRKSSSSGAEVTKRNTRNSTAAKKQRAEHSDSSNYDSELEKKIQKLGNLEEAKKSAKKKAKSYEESESSAEERNRKKHKRNKSTQERGKAAKTQKQSTATDLSDLSEDSHDDDAASHNSDDGSEDEQKIKPLVENEVLTKADFCQSSGDEAGTKSGAAEDEEDDDDDPENRYDSHHTDLKKLITHPKRGSKAKHRKSKQVVQTRTSCLVKTRSQAARKLERVVGKPRPKTRKPMKR
ncbi:PREDICTED: transcriptional regulator ATRX-like [Nanorana parkeri]|uniref:transcriptional regulator ATRX-like n=1 Tax=Nanorana parkeri TaxID=125878 RepID=UPI000854980F|nr:PREDICTED: transcriptional regulator ATRX-like [Nanorana parkeri]